VCLTPNEASKLQAPFLLNDELSISAKHLFEVVDYITLDISGPEIEGIEQFYSGNRLSKLLEKVKLDRELEIGNMALVQHEPKDVLNYSHFFNYTAWNY